MTSDIICNNNNNNKNNSDIDVGVDTQSESDTLIDVIPEELLAKELEHQLQVTLSERTAIECKTKNQCDNPFWYEVRFKRLTGSKSGQVLTQKSWKPSLLQRIIYQKPFVFIPPAIQWGIDHESTACAMYIEFMHANNHLNLTVEECGFLFILKKDGLEPLLTE